MKKKTFATFFIPSILVIALIVGIAWSFTYSGAVLGAGGIVAAVIALVVTDDKGTD